MSAGKQTTFNLWIGLNADFKAKITREQYEKILLDKTPMFAILKTNRLEDGYTVDVTVWIHCIPEKEDRDDMIQSYGYEFKNGRLYGKTVSKSKVASNQNWDE